MSPITGRTRPRISISQLWALMTVVETGGIGSASRQLGISQSAISQAISSLESFLGRKLLDRNKDGVQPTPVAADVLDQARIATQAILQIEQFAIADRDRKPNSLRVAGVLSAFNGIIPECNRTFRAQNPHIQVKIFEGDHIEVGEWVSRGFVDLGVTALAPEGLLSRDIMTEELLAIMPFGHRLLREPVVTIEKLIGETIVLVSKSCEAIVSPYFVANGFHPQFVSSHLIVSGINMVREGIGISIVPRSLLSSIDMYGLRTRSVTPTMARKLKVVLKEDRPVEAISLFVEQLIAHGNEMSNQVAVTEPQ